MCVCVCQSRVCVPERWWLVLVYECCIVGVLCMFMSAPVCVCAFWCTPTRLSLKVSVLLLG